MLSVAQPRLMEKEGGYGLFLGFCGLFYFSFAMTRTARMALMTAAGAAKATMKLRISDAQA